MSDMSRTSLTDDLTASLQDAATVFDPADFDRFVDVAAEALTAVRPRLVRTSLTVEAGTDRYAAPADLVRVHWSSWATPDTKPWDPAYTGRRPRLSAEHDGSQPWVVFRPAPTVAQVTRYGAACPVTYVAQHVIAATATDTTVRAADRGLLILRAQAEAMKEMSLRNIGKPVQMRDGVTQGPKNGTPAALYQQLMDEFGRRA